MNNTITTKPAKPPKYPTDEEVEKIRGIIQQGEDALATFRKSAADRIKATLEFGVFCNRWKPKMPGVWEAWVTKEFPGVSKVQRCRFMRLARYVDRKGAGCLKEATYVTTALQLAGAMPKKTPRVQVRGSPTPAMVAHELVKRIKHWRVDDMPAAKRAELKEALKPIAELYGRL